MSFTPELETITFAAIATGLNPEISAMGTMLDFPAFVRSICKGERLATTG